MNNRRLIILVMSVVLISGCSRSVANTPGADKIGGETDAHAMSTAVEQEPSNVSGDISKTDSGVKEESSESANGLQVLLDKNKLASEFQKYYTSRYDGVGDISAEVSSVLTASADVAKENLARKEGLIRLQDAARVVYYSVYSNIEDLETEPLDGKTKVTLSEFVTVNYRDGEVSDSFSFKIPHVIILTEEMVIASDVYNENTVSGFDNTHGTI